MGRNSGGVMSTKKASVEKRKQMMKELMGLNKKLSIAQASVTRANRALKGAAGGIITAQNSTAKANAEARLKKAERQYRTAVEKHIAIASQRDALKKEYDRLR